MDDAKSSVSPFSFSWKPVFPGEGITSPKSDVFAATWRKKFDRRSIRDDAFAIAIN